MNLLIECEVQDMDDWSDEEFKDYCEWCSLSYFLQEHEEEPEEGSELVERGAV